jgi:hypothetical protein
VGEFNLVGFGGLGGVPRRLVEEGGPLCVLCVLGEFNRVN